MEQVRVSWSLQRSWWGWVAIGLVAKMGFVLLVPFYCCARWGWVWGQSPLAKWGVGGGPSTLGVGGCVGGSHLHMGAQTGHPMML